MEKSLLQLTAKDVDPETLQPANDFITEVAERVVRAGDVRKPGYVMITNPKEVLGRKPSIEQFQWKLMEGLERMLMRTRRDCLEFQPYLEEHYEKKDEIYAKARRALISMYANGVISDKYFHLDIQQFVYVSFCFGQRKNVEGGISRLLDALALTEHEGLPDLRSILEIYGYDESHSGTIFHDEEIAFRVRPAYLSSIEPFIIDFADIDLSQYPVLVFSNYLGDGILHGATPVRARDTTKRLMARPVQLVTIAYTDRRPVYPCQNMVTKSEYADLISMV